MCCLLIYIRLCYYYYFFFETLELLLLRMNVIATLWSIDLKVAATEKSCGKVKVSHAAVKSFDRRSRLSVVRTLEQFSF